MPDHVSHMERPEWEVIIGFLRKIDQHLLARISRRMINHLSWTGVSEAQELLQSFAASRRGSSEEASENTPTEKKFLDIHLDLASAAFEIAKNRLKPDLILSLIQQWIKDDQSGFLAEAVENQGTSMLDIAQALERHEDMGIDDKDLSRAIQVGLRVSLVRRFLTDELDYINVARSYIEVRDFYDLVKRVIAPPRSYGKLGGKGAGLFLATKILRGSPEVAKELGTIKSPKTWYITSDGVLDFIQYNSLEDIYNWKYLEIEQVREEYPHIVQVFKNSHFSTEVIKGLSLALDDFDDRPLIVRSSSLLEDRLGSSFSGKYKSLFLANQGPKRERLLALMDAIAEVYASIFGPDPIEYRAERGLLDVHEEMGILIQEVVGTKVGKYFFPSFAGVAFSNNEFRWSARIRREDGLLRMVPGLGTRAVDRVGEDYPILIAPGQPGLRVNITRDEAVRYSPRKMDVINLESGSFETVPIEWVFRECGRDYPGIKQIVSHADSDSVTQAVFIDFDKDADNLVVTFEGLLRSTPFLARMRTLLKTLREKMGTPVDLEFASDGKDLYLLQCRPQSFTEDASPSPIPVDIPPDKVVFSARRYVSNGRVPDITHVVYVDTEAYLHLPDPVAFRRVGRAVARLNKLLPRRKFVLIGPGRWGSRGDFKLGVSVTYSDINNAAMLIEVARKRGNYMPDLSFGTHFFQDLVEASIRYLPLFPDDLGVTFREDFLKRTPDEFSRIVPDFSDLAKVVYVVDVPKVSDGAVLRVLANAELEEAVAFIAPPGRPIGSDGPDGRAGLTHE